MSTASAKEPLGPSVSRTRRLDKPPEPGAAGRSYLGRPWRLTSDPAVSRGAAPVPEAAVQTPGPGGLTPAFCPPPTPHRSHGQKKAIRLRS